MKKFFLFNIFFLLSLLFIILPVKASDLDQDVKGKILLQVESRGEAWYVDPVSNQKVNLGRPNEAFLVLKNFGIGITDENLAKIPVADKNLNNGVDSDGDGLSDSIELALGTNPSKIDSDGDGFNDKIEILSGYNPQTNNKKRIIDNNFAKNQTGKIFLQVQTNGEAWYINPGDNKRYYLGNPNDALNIMRSLGLGISNNNLNKIKTIGEETTNEDDSNSSEEVKSDLYIKSIKISNGGDKGYIDLKDSIAITFSKAINPSSINSDLKAGSYISDISSNNNGGVSVSLEGYVVVKGIITFDIGDLESLGTFKTKVALNSKGTVLTITLTEGNDIKIAKESFSLTTQLGGVITDTSGYKMIGNTDITNPTGSFGGVIDGGPVISSLRVSNGGNKGYIDIDDYITITFDEAINPASVNSDLNIDSSVSGILYSKTGGVSISSSGVVTIKNIATFDMGTVSASGNFTVKQSLNNTGKILTITLTSGSDIKITNESFGKVGQIANTIKDVNGNKMAKNSSICDAKGSFGGVLSDEEDNDGNSPYISSITVYNKGDDGYIDVDDYVKIVFNEEIDPISINNNLREDGEVTNVLYDAVGGFSIDANGVVIIKGITTFDMGSVKNSGNYIVKLHLNSSSRVLTITLTGGSDITISKESFSSATQIADFVSDNDGYSMNRNSGIVVPSGTFGGVKK
ncbi:MAG TPA: hypothetical protein PLE28_01595 [bacterium]|nr:hypothetical protein [bacterium]